MRKPDEVLKEIINWAIKNQDVRAVILTGSRADPNAIADLFSDYDIEIVVIIQVNFLDNVQWLSFLGCH
ncbi:MAG: aminoglycoside 6-adenylyltransferase [Segetibacter sp.]